MYADSLEARTYGCEATLRTIDQLASETVASFQNGRSVDEARTQRSEGPSAYRVDHCDSETRQPIAKHNKDQFPL
jgi:hypothetical protein